MTVNSPNTHSYRLGTRTSALATTQSHQVRDALIAHGISCDLIPIESSGDEDRKTPLYKIETESPGLFTKQLEWALLDGRIDLAVHSLKDLPTDQPDELYVAAIPYRVRTSDCIILSQDALVEGDILGLKSGSVIGTSSLRREAQILSHRSDLKIVPIRGNVPTRVRQVKEKKVDAVVLAEAGIDRLGLDLEGLVRISLPEDHFVPAPGQGAIAIETRKNIPDELKRALALLHNPIAEKETRLERRVLKELHGGCTLPLGVRVYCNPDGKGEIRLKAFLGLVKDRTASPRQWLGFRHFDISESQAETLVEKTVNYFKEVMT